VVRGNEKQEWSSPRNHCPGLVPSFSSECLLHFLFLSTAIAHVGIGDMPPTAPTLKNPGASV
jgi:hypothetical protein